MTSSLIVTVPPSEEPILIADAKLFLKVDNSVDDSLIGSLITAARVRIETMTYTKLITQTLQLTLDYFPGGRTTGFYSGWWGRGSWPVIELEPPAQSIVSVTYLDPSGNVQTLSSSLYTLDPNSRPARLSPALNQIWPATAQEMAAVTVTYVCGFGAAADVPDDIMQALRLLIGHYYDNRSQVFVGSRLVAIEVPEGFDVLLSNYSPPMVA